MSSEIDWLEAFKYYLSSETISLRDVAEKFGISGIPVKEFYIVKSWLERRPKVY